MNQREVLLLSIGVFCTIIAWILIDIYQAQTTNTVRNEFQQVAVPKQSIDGSIFTTLEQKQP